MPRDSGLDTLLLLVGGIKRAMPYAFKSPEQLLTDFFDAVDKALEARRRQI